jgi:hypothetical protein
MKRTREEWLNAATKSLRPLFKAAGNDAYPKKLKVSCGWPGGGSARTRIGECWSETCSSKGATEIFISPSVAEKVKVLDILAHELVHAIVGVKEGHGPVFKRLATKLGLAGKMTATVAGPELCKQLKAIAKKLGHYPHAVLTISGRKKQTTRMIKCECRACGYACRTTSKWLESLGAPICPGCDVQMEVPIK